MKIKQTECHFAHSKMSIINLHILLYFFVFFLLFHRIKCNVGALTEQKQNASRSQYDIFSKTLDGTDNSTTVENDGMKLKLNGVFKNILDDNSKPQEKLEPNKIEGVLSLRLRRQANDYTNSGDDHGDETGLEEPLAERKRKRFTTKPPPTSTTPKKKKQRKSNAHSIQSSLCMISSLICLTFIKPLMLYI